MKVAQTTFPSGERAGPDDFRGPAANARDPPPRIRSVSPFAKKKLFLASAKPCPSRREIPINPINTFLKNLINSINLIYAKNIYYAPTLAYLFRSNFFQFANYENNYVGFRRSRHATSWEIPETLNSRSIFIYDDFLSSYLSRVIYDLLIDLYSFS